MLLGIANGGDASAWAVLEGLQSGIAILNEDGEAVYLNLRWREITQSDGATYLENFGVEESCLLACQRVFGEASEGAQQAAAGIALVLSSEADAFDMEGRWRALGAERRLGLRASILLAQGRRFVCVELREGGEAAQGREGILRELLALDRVAAGEMSAATSRLYGKMSLRESQPEVFASLLRAYERTLAKATEQEIASLEACEEALQEMGEQLGFLRAGPRDVIDLHAIALRRSMSESPEAQVSALLEAGRLVVLEVMGRLVSYYRKYSWLAHNPQGAPYSEGAE